MTSVTRLSQFGFLSITGKDAMKFLQGYATCDLAEISDTRSVIGATCNLQGRMVASFRILGIENGYLLRMHRELVSKLAEFLSKYIVFSKAEMTDLSDELWCYGVMCDVKGEVKGEVKGDVNSEVKSFPAEPGASLAIGTDHTIRVSVRDRFEVWTRDADYTLPAAELATIDDWTASEIEDGIAWVSDATAGEFIPQMFGYHEIGAVDFDKGCYLGQEIVARMQYRGNVNRLLHRGSTPSGVQAGDSILDAGEKRIGMIVSAASQDGGTVFLAVVQAKDNITPAGFLPGGEALALERVSRT